MQSLPATRYTRESQGGTGRVHKQPGARSDAVAVLRAARALYAHLDACVSVVACAVCLW